MSEADATAETLRHWSAVASAWEMYRDRLFEDVRSVSDWMVEYVNPQPGQTVLELAAGPGETGFLAAARLGSTGRLISSDFVPAMVGAAAFWIRHWLVSSVTAHCRSPGGPP